MLLFCQLHIYKGSQFLAIIGTDMCAEIDIQSHLGIRDTQRTVKNCPQLRGGLISQVHLCVTNTPLGTEVAVRNSKVVPISQVVVKIDLTVHSICIDICTPALHSDGGLLGSYIAVSCHRGLFIRQCC